MNSTVFKYKHHYQQQHQHQHQHQHFNRRSNNKNQNSNNGNNCDISSHNNNNQNSIFILNTATNNILPDNHQLYYSELNENKDVNSSASSAAVAGSSAAAPPSVWSSASSTMCSPAAHALQKLFNCSSSSFKFSHGYKSGIESKGLKSKSEILKKKSKFWKYLEDEDNDKYNQKGIVEAVENDKRLLGKSDSKSLENDDRNQEDLSELLEYSCSLCDNCRCVDCQIGYFDCENSDDSDSEYSFHLSAYEEDEEPDNALERPVALKSSSEVYNCLSTQKLEFSFELPSNCCAAYCADVQQNCANTECCQRCIVAEMEDAAKDGTNHPNFMATKDH